MLGHGVDLFEVRRIAEKLDDAEFLRSLFTSAELSYCFGKHSPAPHLAARFAAKEAMLKALAAAHESGWFWTEIEITNDAQGAPEVRLSGRIQTIAERLGVRQIHLSLSHTPALAMAGVIIEYGNA